ncbi:MAG: hypothetical protein Q7U75_03685 [Desulfobacterales bacterium]|nr:hypothetical protein [Desulfobacterales bacterium]
MANDIGGAFLDILERASEEFSNHGCTEYWLPDTPDNRALVARIESGDGDDDHEGPETEENGIFVEDWVLLDYLAKGIREGRIAIIEKG